jgi:uncharacterized membrane protein
MHFPKTLIIVLFVCALIGFADSAFLTARHLQGVIPPCGGLGDCDQVLTSRFASIGPVPVAAFGMGYYGMVLVLLVAFFDTANRRFAHLAAWVVTAGMLGTLYFLAIQLFVLKSICPYCMLSALLTTTMFILSVRFMRAD